ncbi:ATP-dependent DNA helicase PIF1 [Holothuria leucospilota]|uniref:ATP-dependent DNA helicase n=1 Tax=Holothuria leucospilota TaxID=206669 RepID=A0A9Q1HKE6_HOLLE|nr:ATP-dependent DNA helicase PIF1 [Holothuria leucospilota]
MFWIENAPTLTNNTAEEIVTFVDQYISCSDEVSDKEQANLQLQKHKHSKTCRKGGKPICRFGFPKPPMIETTLLSPLQQDVSEDERLQAKLNYQKVSKLLSDMKDGQNFSHEEFLNQLNLTQSQYIMCLQTSINTPTIFLKRSPKEIRTNPYMKSLLDTYGANHDIQFVTDPYACAVYIVAYMSKSQRGMSLLLDQACKEAKNGNSDIQNQVKSIGNKFLNAVEVSAQEAAYLLLQLPITRSSRNVIFINTSPPDERTFLLKSKEDLEQMDPDDTDIECGNIIKRYSQRPHLLEQYCLADYASKINIIYPKEIQDPYDDCYEDDPFHMKNESQDEAQFLSGQETVNVTLKSGVQIKSCSTPKIIRFVNYNQKTDPENYFRERVMLYVPWRNENKDILQNQDSFEKCFIKNQAQIESKMREYEPHKVIQLDELAQAYLEDNSIDEISQLIPSTEHTEQQDRLEGSTDCEQLSFYSPHQQQHKIYDMCADLGMTNNTSIEITTFCPRIPENEYLELLTVLNKKQREFYLHVMESITSMENPLHVFLTGGAGVGKSVVIKVLYQSLHRYLNSIEGTDPDDCKIILCAPTGKAAFNINGLTIHSAFQIDPNRGYNFLKLNSDKLNSLQVKYRHLQVVIIDEISMVGNKQLLFINERLKEIKQNQQPFGGVHIIAVGDLYQLKPVMDSWIFENLEDGYGALATNIWRNLFSVHELTQIMRQKDDQEFAELLNRLREGNQTQIDIQELQKCLTNQAHLNNSIIHLYPTNALVDTHNSHIFKDSKKEKIIIQAVDTIGGDYPATVKQDLKKRFPTVANKTAGLMLSLPVAVDSIYETVANIDVNDGITNGSSCIVKHIQYLDINNPKPSIIWVQFDKETVGQITRAKYKKYFGPFIDTSWTPIFAISRNFFITPRKIMVTRQQFPLRPATAKTIHKSQGDTVHEIAVHMGSTKIEHAHYVAFSRVRTKKGLHIIHLNEKKITTSEKVKLEMKRIQQNSPMKLCYKPFYNITSPNIKITLQNARSLHKHIRNIASDQNIMSSDIISVVETRLRNTDNPQTFALQEFSSIRNDQPCTGQMAAMVMFALTEPENRGQNYFFHGMSENLQLHEVYIMTVNNIPATPLRNKISAGKYYVLQHYSLNQKEETNYLRLTSDKSKEGSLTSPKMSYNPEKCTIPEALASPKKRRLSVEGTIVEIYPLKEGHNWKRRDIIIEDPPTARKICCKLWNAHADSVQEKDRGSTATFNNMEVDIYNDRHQLRTTGLTTLTITTTQTANKYHIIGVDPEPDNLTLITECGNTFQMTTNLLETIEMSATEFTNKTPVFANLEIQNNKVMKIELMQ